MNMTHAFYDAAANRITDPVAFMAADADIKAQIIRQWAARDAQHAATFADKVDAFLSDAQVGYAFLTPQLHRIETELMGKFDEGKLPADPHLMLRLAIETVAHDYDVIVIDSAPNLGIGTINVVCAADVLIVPTPAELFDYTSALQFFDMLRDLLKNVDLKGFEPDVRILLTKYSNNNGSQSPWMEEQIRDAWGSMVLKNVVRETDEVGKGQIRMRTVFEQAIDQRSSTGAWRNALSIWEPVCNEIFDRLIKPRWEIR